MRYLFLIFFLICNSIAYADDISDAAAVCAKHEIHYRSRSVAPQPAHSPGWEQCDAIVTQDQTNKTIAARAAMLSSDKQDLAKVNAAATKLK